MHHLEGQSLNERFKQPAVNNMQNGEITKDLKSG